MKIQSVRIYNKALTQTEIDNNFEVDNNRFINPPVVTVGGQPCTNLVVISANEIRCRTPAMDSDTQFVNTPYDVELTYDGETKTATQQFTYKNFTLTSISPNRGPVKGGNVVSIFGENFPYVSTEDYEQDGLVAHYDGINNTGQGDKFRSTTTATWKNLENSGVLPDGEVCANANCSTLGPSSKLNWTSNSMRFDVTNDSAWVRINKPSYMPGQFTLEAVIKPNYNSTTKTFKIIDNLESGGFGININENAGSGEQDYLVLVEYLNGGYKVSNRHQYTSLLGRITSMSGQLINNADDGCQLVLYANGVGTPNQISGSPCTIGAPANNTVWGIGTNPQGARGTDDWLQDSDVYSIRLYDRALTAEEVAQNAALDQIRYQSVPTVKIGGADCTNVAVVSSSELQCTVPQDTSGDPAPKNVVVTQSDTGHNAQLPGAYTYVHDDNDFYIFSQSINHGNPGDVIAFTGNKLDQVSAIEIGGNDCAILDPPAPTNSTISCTVPPETDYTTNTKDIEFTVSGFDPLTLEQAWTYDEFLSLNTTGSDIDLQPTPNGGVAIDGTIYTIDTNSATGYSLTIQTDNADPDYASNPNDLLCKVGAKKYFLKALTTANPTLPDNYWSYRTPQETNTDWQTPKSTAQTIKTRDGPTDPTPSNSDSLTLTYGVNVDFSTPACSYAGKVLVSLVPNF